MIALRTTIPIHVSISGRDHFERYKRLDMILSIG
jgi:hypothetical protein